MDLLPSAHSDTFARDRLPPSGQWPELVFDIDDVRYPERLNCAAELLGGALERFGPDRRCLITDAETWTYGELDERSDQVAHVLADDLDIVPGNRVLLCGPNSPWLVACWLGVLKAGAVVVTVVPLLRAAEIATVAEIAEVSVALCAAGALRQLSGVGVRDRRDVLGRRRADRLHLGHHGPSEGLHALPPGRPGDRRHVRPPHSQTDRL